MVDGSTAFLGGTRSCLKRWWKAEGGSSATAWGLRRRSFREALVRPQA